jgi:trehalose synthase
VLNQFIGISPKSDLLLLQLLGAKLYKRSFLHINSTRTGGGVAEILQRMIPILQELGIDARWEIIEGDPVFFDITKKIHNSLQGNPEKFAKKMWQYHYEINRKNAEYLNLEADAVIIHDPQPAPLIEFKKAGLWIWRCHIDLSNPHIQVWDYLSRYIAKYDATIFSVAKFARAIPINKFIITPSIDPISEKNRGLREEEITETLNKFQIPVDRPIILQVSRFDRFKDPVGVIKAFRSVIKYNDCIILAGSPY